MDNEDPRGPHHKNSCPRLFTTNWEYRVNHNLKNLTELSDHSECVSKLEDGEVVDDPAQDRHVKNHKRKKGQHAKSSIQSSHQDSGATSSQSSAPNVQQ